MIFVGDGELRGRLLPYKSSVANHCANGAHRSFRAGVIADEFGVIVAVVSRSNQCVCVAKHDPHLQCFIFFLPFSVVDDVVCVGGTGCFCKTVLCDDIAEFSLCFFDCHVIFFLPFW